MSPCSTLSLNHAKILSKTALFLNEAATKIKSETSAPFTSSTHVATTASDDVETMWEVIRQNRVEAFKGRRQCHTRMLDPRVKGLEKIEDGWLRSYILKGDVEIARVELGCCDDSKSND